MNNNNASFIKGTLNKAIIHENIFFLEFYLIKKEKQQSYYKCNKTRKCYP